MRKDEYNRFADYLEKLMRGYHAECHEDHTYFVTTPYGKLRIHAEAFDRNHKTQWLYTKLEHPEQLPEWLKKQSGINAFNGKNNVYSESFYRLFAWMDDYIQDLRNPLETKQCRDQVLMMTFGKENRTEMEG